MEPSPSNRNDVLSAALEHIKSLEAKVRNLEERLINIEHKELDETVTGNKSIDVSLVKQERPEDFVTSSDAGINNTFSGVTTTNTFTDIKVNSDVEVASTFFDSEDNSTYFDSNDVSSIKKENPEFTKTLSNTGVDNTSSEVVTNTFSDEVTDTFFNAEVNNDTTSTTEDVSSIKKENPEFTETLSDTVVDNTSSEVITNTISDEVADTFIDAEVNNDTTSTTKDVSSVKKETSEFTETFCEIGITNTYSDTNVELPVRSTEDVLQNPDSPSTSVNEADLLDILLSRTDETSADAFQPQKKPRKLINYKYSCSICDQSFSVVKDHIKNHHQDLCPKYARSCIQSCKSSRPADISFFSLMDIFIKTLIKKNIPAHRVKVFEEHLTFIFGALGSPGSPLCLSHIGLFDTLLDEAWWNCEDSSKIINYLSSLRPFIRFLQGLETYNFSVSARYKIAQLRHKLRQFKKYLYKVKNPLNCSVMNSSQFKSSKNDLRPDSESVIYIMENSLDCNRQCSIELNTLAYYKCAKCNTCFETEQQYRRHLGNTHHQFSLSDNTMERYKNCFVKLNKLKFFQCKKCDIYFETEEHLNRHIESGNEVQAIKGTSPKYVLEHRCRVCSRSFKNIVSLRQHMESHVTYSHYSTESENEIQEIERTSPKYYVLGHRCKQCFKSFETISSFRKHLNFHKTDRLYSICNE